MATEKEDITSFLYNLDITKFKSREYRKWVSSKFPKYSKRTLLCYLYVNDENIKSYDNFEKNLILDFNVDSDSAITRVNGVSYRGGEKFTQSLPLDFNEDREVHISSEILEKLTLNGWDNKPFTMDITGDFDTCYALYDSRHFEPRLEGIRRQQGDYYNVATIFYLKDTELSDILYPVISGKLRNNRSPSKSWLYTVYYNFSNTVFENPLSLSRLKMGDNYSTEEMFKNCTFPIGFSFGEWVSPEIFSTLDYFLNYSVSMFEGCTFPDNFYLDFPNQGVEGPIGHCSRMFANCKFGKNFRFNPNFINFESCYIKEFFAGSIIPEDFSLKNQFVVLDEGKYKYIKLEDYNLVNLFKDCVFLGSLKSSVDNILSNPSIENKDFEILQLLIHGKEYTRELTDKLSVESCSEELKKYIINGYSLQQCIYKLSRSGNYSEDQIIRGYNKIHSILLANCFKSVPKYLFKTTDNGNSITVGQAREALMSKGYPKNIVDEAIVDYLKDQILV